MLCGPENPWLNEAVWPKLGDSREAVVCTGRLNGFAVFEHLASADLHVNPSLCESLNMVTVEAAAVGTPTVTSDGAGIADWVRRCDAGAVVPAGEAAPLADAIIRALRAPETLTRWSTNARSMAEEFQLERIAPAMIELMRSPVQHPAE